MMQQEMLSLISWIALLFPVLVCVFTFRGFFKALVAKLMGDRTPQEEGFLTLNPMAHVDVFGLTTTMVIILVLGFVFGGGLPRGSILLILIVLGIRWTTPVIVDSRNFKYYRLGGILTSLAGSLGNILLAFLMLCCFKFMPFHLFPLNVQKTLVELMQLLVYVAVWFGVIDLIPIPPFDGGKALYYMLPRSQQHVIEMLEEYSFYIILVLVFMPGISDIFFGGLSVAREVIIAFLERLIF